MPTWKQVDLDRVAERMLTTAATGLYTGRESEINGLYFMSCRQRHYGTTLICTRDGGHHTSGWMKNPDYERCLHLSMSPMPSQIWTRDTPDFDTKLRDGWLNAFFKGDLRYVWAESPKTPEGRKANVWHWRLFCDENWVPMLPRGEVYSRKFTELGWKSASELGVEIISVLDPE